MENGDLLLFIIVFNAIAAFNTLAAITLMGRGFRTYSPANRMLAFFLFCTAMVNLMLFLIYSGWINRVPWLYRLPSPLYYMMFPAAWLYVRMIIRDQVSLRKSDAIHFLPGLLHAVEMLPYYLKSLDYKIRHVLDDAPFALGAYMHSEGLLPPYVHNLLRGIQGTIYGSIMLYLVYQSFYGPQARRSEFPRMKKWLTAFSVCVFVFGFSIFVTFLGSWASPSFRALNLSFFIAATQTVTALSLLTHPELMFGMPELDYRTSESPKPIPVSLPEPVVGVAMDKAITSPPTGAMSSGSIAPAKPDPEWIQHYLPKLDAYVAEANSYLRPRYALSDMAHELSIPHHHLSFLLNRVYNLRFNDFINRLRIDYLQKRIREEDILKTRTLEGLAREAGFANRTTFIRVVQKITGMNPSEYFHQKAPHPGSTVLAVKAPQD